MNYREINTKHDFKTIIDSPFLLTGSTKDRYTEISENTWAIALTPATQKSITASDIAHFLDILMSHLQKQVQSQKISATFYVWFDEMACQLRFNVISGCAEKLPFGCTVALVTKHQEIIETFLASTFHDGIPFEQLEAVDIFDDENDEEAVRTKHVLKVYAVCLGK